MKQNSEDDFGAGCGADVGKDFGTDPGRGSGNKISE
jgi:hypothetical protein